MGKKQVEDAVINVVINGEKAISSFRELNQLRREQAKLVENLNKNSPEYAQQQRRLEDLNAAQKVWRAEINNSTAAIDRMNEEMGETSKSGFFDKMKSMFSKDSLMVAGGNLIADGFQAGLSAIKSFIDGSEAAYIEAVKGQAQLDAALKSTGGVAGETKESLNDLAGALMEQTGIDDDVISKGEEMLLTFTNIRGKIYEQALPAIVDMTSAMNQGTVSMEGIQAQTIQVGKALNDPIKGITALAKVGVTFTEQQKEQIKTLVESNRMMDAQSIILQELSKEFGGTAKAIADTDVGAMQKFETRLGNIQENIGGWLVKGKSLAAEVLNPFLGWLEKVTTTKLSETLHEDQKALFSLRIELESNNTTAARRREIIDQLKVQYPGYLTQIDSDKVKNSELLTILDRINESYVLRIAYQKRAEKLDDAAKQEAEAMNNSFDQSIKLRGQLADLQQQLNEDGIKFTIKGRNENEKALYVYKNLINSIRDQAKSNRELNDVLGTNKYDYLVAGLNSYGNSIRSANDKLKDAHKTRVDIENDLQAFKNSTGYDEKNPPPVKPKVVDATSGELTEAERDKAEKKAQAARDKEKAAQEKAAKELADYKQNLKDAQAEVNRFIADATKGTADNLDAQLQVINDKYQKLIDRFKELNANKNATTEDRKNNNAAIGDLEHTRDNEKDGVKATVNYNAFEQTVNDDAERQVNQAKDDLANHLTTEEDFAASELLIEQQRLTDLFDLRTLFGMQTLDLENKLADGRIKSEKKAADGKMKLLKEQQKGEEEYQRVQKVIAAQKSELAETGVQILVAAFGKSKGVMLAQLALEKAIAIGKIVAAEAVEIAGYYAHPASIATLGASGTVLAAAAKVRAGLSIAQIVATGLLQGASIAGSDSGSKSDKKFARGGILPTGPSHAAGGLNLVDPYGMVYGNVEGGEPILSKDTYTNNRSLVDALLNSNGRQLNMDRIQDATMNRERRVSNPVASASQDLEQDANALLANINNNNNREIFDQLVLLTESVQNQELVFSNRVFEENRNKVAQIKNDANA